MYETNSETIDHRALPDGVPATLWEGDPDSPDANHASTRVTGYAVFWRARDLRLEKGQSGFTLIELVIAVVVLAAAAAGVLLIFANATAHSADPQVRAQARSIAEAYMDEILLQPYADPDDPETGHEGETRAEYDDVWDYNAIGTEAPTDMSGNLIDGLASYDVTVSVEEASTGVALINVRVQQSSGLVDYKLASERHQY